MSHTEVIDPDGWVRSVRRVDWSALSWQPYEAVAVDPGGRRFGPVRTWTREGGWKLTRRIKRRVTR